MINNKRKETASQSAGIRLLKKGSHRDQELRRLLDANPDWFKQRCLETDVVCALPEFENNDWASTLPLTKEDYEREKQFSEICDQQELFAVDKYRQRVESSLVLRWESRFTTKELLDLMPEDWLDKKVDRNYQAVQKSDENSIWKRRTATAGMMICKPGFLDERNELKAMWQKLSSTEQPSLTLIRSRKIPVEYFQSVGTRFPDSSAYSQELEQFTRKFDQFCDYWRLMRMITWDLPDPMGPSDKEHPWLFPAHHSDGIVDSLIVKSTGIADQHGFDDQGSWDSYCSIMKIDHWERTINARYADRPKPKGGTTKLLHVLSNLLGVGFDRVKRLRRWKKQLVNGEISSLKGLH